MSQMTGKWAFASEGRLPVALQTALAALGRDGLTPELLTNVPVATPQGIRGLAASILDGRFARVVIGTKEAALVVCLANKMNGIRAAAVDSVHQAENALRSIGVNLLVIDPTARTYFELRQILRLCATWSAACPMEFASQLEELGAHAHR